MKKVSFRVRNFDKEQFLTYNIDNEALLDEDVLDFLEDEEPKGLVPVIFEEGEEFDTFSYNITDKIHVCELSDQEINAEMVLRVMRGLVLALMDMSEYRVPLSYLVLNRNYIYINSDYEVEFICVPLDDMQEEVDLNAFLRNFLANLRFESSENGDYVAKLLSYINNTAIFKLRNFATLIEELMDERGIDIPEDSATDIYVDYQEVIDEEDVNNSIEEEDENALIHSDEEYDEESDEDSEEEYDEEYDEDSEEEYDEEYDEDSEEEYDEEYDEDSEEEYDEEYDEDSEEEYDEESDEDSEEEYDEEYDEDSEQEYDEESDEDSEEGSIEETAEEVETEPVEEVAEEAETEPVEETVEEAEAEPVEETVEEAEAEPVEETVEEAEAEPVEETVEEAEAEPVEEAVKEAEAEPVEEAVKEAEAEPVEVAVKEAEDEPVEEAVKEAEAEPVEAAVKEAEAEPEKEATEKPEEKKENALDDPELQSVIDGLKLVVEQEKEANQGETKPRKKTKITTKATTTVGGIGDEDFDDFIASRELGLKRPHNEFNVKQKIKVNRASIVKSNQEEVEAKAAEEAAKKAEEEAKRAEEEATRKAEEVAAKKAAKEAKKAAEAKVAEEAKSEETETSITSSIAAVANSILAATETVPKANPYLIRVNTEERIMITKQTFKVGKATIGVDYSVRGNNAISRVHAIITGKDDNYYVRDNKSTNHTIVNGKILEEGENELLTDDCKIVLGDEEFVFKLR